MLVQTVLSWLPKLSDRLTYSVQTFPILIHGIPSDFETSCHSPRVVLARLGLGWFQPAQFPGQAKAVNYGLAPAWPGLGHGFVCTNEKILCSSLVAIVQKHFNKDVVHVKLAHLSVQTYLTPEEIQMGKVKHISFSHNLCTP